MVPAQRGKLTFSFRKNAEANPIKMYSILSRENAKFKSTFERTNSQTHKEKTLNTNASQARGIMIILNINFTTFLTVSGWNSFREFITCFKSSWFAVSHILVIAIKNITKIRLIFMAVLNCH